MDPILQHAIQLCIFAAIMPFIMVSYSRSMWRRINNVRQLDEAGKKKAANKLSIVGILIMLPVLAMAVLNQVIDISSDTRIYMAFSCLLPLAIIALLMKELHEYKGKFTAPPPPKQAEKIHKKPSFDNSGLGYYAQNFTDNKKQVSNGHYYTVKFLCVAVIVSIAYIVYQQNSQSLEASIMAIGGTAVMFSFLANSNKSNNRSTGKLIGLFIFCWLIIEMFSAFGARMAASNNHSLNQINDNKSGAKSELVRLKAERLEIKKAKYSRSDEAALLAKNSKAINNEKKQSRVIVQSNEKQLHNEIQEITGVNNIGSIRYGIMSALFIFGSSLLVKMSGGLYCNRSLKNHIKQSKETLEIMASCEAENLTESKNGSTVDHETKGLEENQPKGKLKTMGDYEGCKAWVERVVMSGGYIGAEPLKKATGTTAPHQQKAIIEKLIRKKVIERKGKAVKKYYRVDAKQAALNQMKSTAKLFNIVEPKSVVSN